MGAVALPPAPASPSARPPTTPGGYAAPPGSSEDPTFAGRPGARRGPSPMADATGELDLGEMVEVPRSGGAAGGRLESFAGYDEPQLDFPSDSSPPLAEDEDEGWAPLDQEPTIARAPQPIGQLDDDLFESEPTAARDRPLLADLPGAHGGAPAGFAPSAGPRPSAPGPVARGGAPPTERPPPGAPAPARTGPPRTLLLGVAVAALVLLVVVVLGAVVYSGIQAEEELTAAADAAGDDALAASLDRALGLDAEHAGDDDVDVARRARLHAFGLYEHGRGDRGAVEAVLSRLSPEGQALSDAQVARAYLFLAVGDLARARMAADALATVGDAEPAHARALVLEAGGDASLAVAAARSAVTAHPTAPRHIALFARLTAEEGDRAAGLSALDGVPGGPGAPIVRVARARILAREREGLEPGAAEARVVLGELASLASRRQTAWAHVIVARAALAQRNMAAAREHVGAARDRRGAGDELLGLAIVEVLLGVGDAPGAKAVLEALPQPPYRPVVRARLAAEVYLENGQLDVVQQVLTQAGDGPRMAYLRGRLAEARGDLDGARRQYQAAGNDASQFVVARARLGALELNAGRAGAAVDLLRPAVERVPDDLEAVPLLVRALLEEEQSDAAGAVLDAALARRPDSQVFLIARAQVDLAAGRARDALESLTRLVAERPNDAGLHSMLGEAARAVGDATRARQAYQRALELDERDAVALVGLVRLALDGGDVDAVRQSLERAERGGVSGREIDVARARLMVLEGAGAAAVELLTRLTRRSRDAALWAALGWASLQAEDERGAQTAFRQALRRDGDNFEAHLGDAIASVRRGSLSGASRSIGSAERVAAAQGLGPSAEARVLAARALVQFNNGALAEARESAQSAVTKDAQTSLAHLVLALIAEALDEDATEHLRRAVAGRMPMPEALGRLVLVSRDTTERCDLARRYLEAAPRGYDARDVRDRAERCR